MTRRLIVWRTVAISASVGGSAGRNRGLQALGGAIDKDALEEDHVEMEMHIDVTRQSVAQT